jgi:hypothetical protein
MAEATSDVNVTLLLAGGHKSSLRLPQNDPLLRSLLASIEDKADGGARVPRPYHLHVEEGEGKRSLIFSGRDLVGITVDPPRVLRDPAAEAAGHPKTPKLVV